MELRYARDRFTSRVIGLKVWYASLLNEPLVIRLEAYDTEGAKQKVGDAADCAARDEDTHEVTLPPNAETEVPVLIGQDFSGPAIEIRVMSLDYSIVWSRLKLKNGIMD
jgi:hypothetical protein